MADQAVFTWPAANTTAIASVQTLAGAGSIVIDGPLVPLTYNYAVFPGISRTVSLTSANNLSAVNVTITGLYRGAAQSQTIAGPNANTVYTTSLFDTVTSVTTDAAVTAMSVGSGTTGQTHWWTYNKHATVCAFAAQVVVTGTINYSFQTTLDDVQTNATPTVFTPIVAMTAATTNQFAGTIFPTLFSNIIINSSAGGSLVATFLQQGIT